MFEQLPAMNGQLGITVRHSNLHAVQTERTMAWLADCRQHCRGAPSPAATLDISPPIGHKLFRLATQLGAGFLHQERQHQEV